MVMFHGYILISTLTKLYTLTVYTFVYVRKKSMQLLSDQARAHLLASQLQNWCGLIPLLCCRGSSVPEA